MRATLCDKCHTGLAIMTKRAAAEKLYSTISSLQTNSGWDLKPCIHGLEKSLLKSSGKLLVQVEHEKD